MLRFVRLDFENDDYAHLKSKIKPQQNPVEEEHHLPTNVVCFGLFFFVGNKRTLVIKDKPPCNFSIDKQDRHHHLQPSSKSLKLASWLLSFGGWAHPIAMALPETWWK